MQAKCLPLRSLNSIRVLKSGSVELTRHAARMEATEMNPNFSTSKCKGQATNVDGKTIFQQISNTEQYMWTQLK